MRKFLIFGFLLIAQILNARQSADDSLLFKPVFQNLTGEAYSDHSFTHKGIHFRDEFLPGKIWFTNGDSLGDLSLRYNSFEDQLIWLSKKHGQVLLDRATIAKFSFKNRDTAFLFKKLQLPAADTGFSQVCYEGEIKLYVKRKSVPYTSYIRNSIKYYKYRQAPVYCLMVRGKVYIINRNIKNLYQLFPAKEDAIRNSIRGKRLHFKREGDFIKAIIGMEKILTE
jgi:hypothetical protein